jgi:hypothetical protein
MSHKIIETYGGDNITEVALKAYIEALRNGNSAEFRFNGVTCIMVPSAVHREKPKKPLEIDNILERQLKEAEESGKIATDIMSVKYSDAEIKTSR